MTKRPGKKKEPVPQLSIRGRKVNDAALHKEILNNPVANKLADQAAIELAVKDGMSREEAERFFGGEFDPSCLDEE